MQRIQYFFNFPCTCTCYSGLDTADDVSWVVCRVAKTAYKMAANAMQKQTIMTTFRLLAVFLSQGKVDFRAP